VNDERDVLYVVVGGSATLVVDGEATELGVGEATIVEKGASRALVAGLDGVRYVTAHIRRGGLAIKSATPRSG
jgi:quercetin dioxygenase-like cupin family protein